MSGQQNQAICGTGIPPFGAELKRLRQALSIGQRELGRRTRYAGSYICSIEAGRVPSPSDEAVLRLADALQLDEQAAKHFVQLADEARTSGKQRASRQPALWSKELKLVLETAAELATRGGVTVQVLARGVAIKVLPPS